MIASPCVASSLRVFKFREKMDGVAGARE